MKITRLSLVGGGLLILSIGYILYVLRTTNEGTATLNTDATIPDFAAGFGYNCMWFAIKTSNQQKVVELLKLKNISKCNWKVGIKKAYDSSVFITPCIDGWILVCGSRVMPEIGNKKESLNEGIDILKGLSKEFGEAQFFCTFHVPEYHCWEKALNGEIDRIYCYSGEIAENIMIEGEPTEFEKKFKLINTFSNEAKDTGYFERTDIVYPDEELVMKIAENWSINPTKIEGRPDLFGHFGLLGKR